MQTRATVTGFVATQPDLLDASPAAPASAGRAWPSRRTWTMLADVLAYLRDDDTASVHAATYGLVGETAGVQFLTWREHADLPDPTAVITDPSGVDWQTRPDRVWAILNGVTGWAVARGSIEAWRQAWGPLAAAVEAGATDIGVVAARTLLRARPTNAGIPRAAKTLLPVLTSAGLLTPDQTSETA